jgi:hypothetical protein
MLPNDLLSYELSLLATLRLGRSNKIGPGPNLFGLTSPIDKLSDRFPIYGVSSNQPGIHNSL